MLCISSACSQKGGEILRPDYLKPGDKVVVIAPSYCAPDSLIDKGMDELHKAGLVPVEAPHLRTRYPADYPEATYAGTDQERASDILWALRDPEIKALLCIRGGYGAVHLLPMIPLSEIRKARKWIVGYSDISVLQAAWTKAGVMSIQGPIITAFAKDGLENQDNSTLISMLMGERQRYEFAPDSLNNCGKATGTLVGGNMINFLTLMGTSYDCIEGRDCILFLEETAESMHSMDRLMNILLYSKNFHNIKGIVFGTINEYDADLPVSSPEEMLWHYTSGLDIPVCYGFPCGHGDRCAPLMLGAEVTLEVTNEGCSLTF